MTATREQVSFWDQLPIRTVHPTILAAQNKIWKGTNAMQINGVVYNLDQDLTPYMLTIAGVDANGGLRFWSREKNVFVTIGKSANSKLGVFISYNTNQVIVSITLAADGGANVTSFAQDVYQLLLGHAEARKLLHFAYTGAGTSAPGLTPTVSVPHWNILGLAEETYDNVGNATALTYTQSMRFKQAVCRQQVLTSDPISISDINSMVAIVDCNTIKGTLTPIDYPVKLIDVSPGPSGEVMVELVF